MRRVDDVGRARDLLPAARAAVIADGIRAFVCVPIRARQRILGTLSLGRQTEDRFSDEEVALLECVADQIGLALDNARLYSETRQQLEELSARAPTWCGRSGWPRSAGSPPAWRTRSTTRSPSSWARST